MAKKVYIGQSDLARKVNEIYLGINGKARKVVKGYVGVNGVARQFWPELILYYWNKYNTIATNRYYWNRYNVEETPRYYWDMFYLNETTYYRWSKRTISSSENITRTYQQGSGYIFSFRGNYYDRYVYIYTNGVYNPETGKVDFNISNRLNYHNPDADSGEVWEKDYVTSSDGYFIIVPENDRNIESDGSYSASIVYKSMGHTEFNVYLSTTRLSIEIYPYSGTQSEIQQIEIEASPGTIQEYVESTNSSAYPQNGISGNYWYEYDSSRIEYSKGSLYISAGASSPDISRFPNDGQQGNYWYTYSHEGVDYNKGSANGSVNSTNRSQYPDNGRSGNYWYVYDRQTTSYSQGSYIGVVQSENPSAYPNNGRHTDGYWYVKQ